LCFRSWSAGGSSPLDFWGRAYGPAHSVVCCRPKRLTYGARGCNGRTYPGTMSASAAPVTQMPSIHGGHAGCACVSQFQAFVALERPLWNGDDPRHGTQPIATFPSGASFRAPATGHLIHADPWPPLEAPISPTFTSALPHPAAEANACRSSSLSTEMSIPTTISTAVLVAAATLIAVGSSTSGRRVANRNVFPLSLSLGTLIIMAPVIALFHVDGVDADLLERDFLPCRSEHVGVRHLCPLVQRQSHRGCSRCTREHGRLRRLRRSLFCCCSSNTRFRRASPPCRWGRGRHFLRLFYGGDRLPLLFTPAPLLGLHHPPFTTLQSPPSCSLGSADTWVACRVTG
jgi:hypothetical protein